MLYLLNKDVRTVRWNGEPLHESTSAIVKETMNGDFTLTVKYPISDSGIYQLIKEDMLIKAPTPVLGAQLFRIKKPVEHNDHLEITAYHISDDVMQRSITPMSVTSQSCGMALSRMVQNTKTALGDFSFNSDIQDRRTFNTTETETLYSVLLDGKHSIVGTWEGELVRDNFALTVKRSRGENRGVVITTHKNLKDYQRTRNSQNVVTRIHAKSTFKPEGAEKETTIRVTVDSPLINSYPYINEKEYENNNAKTVEELQKWAQAKFSNEGIDKVSDAIKIEAYELDGQVVHIGDTVNLKSWKHNVDAFKKAIAYEFDALKEEYISLTFDDKAGTGGSRASGGLSSAADAILGVTESAQEIALEKALQNADLGFDHQAGLLRQEIADGIELARAKAEEVKQELSDTIDQRFNSFNNGPLQEAKRRAEEALRNAGASTLLAQEAKRTGLDSVAKLEEFKKQATSAQTALSGDLDALKRTIANDIRPKQAQAEAEISKQVEALVQTKNELAGVKSAQATYEETTTRRLAELTSLADGKASKSELAQTADELASKIASVKVDGRNYYRDSEKVQTKTRFFAFPLHPYLTQENIGETWTLSFDLKINEGGEIRPLHFYHYQTNRFGIKASGDITPSKEWQRFTFTGSVIFPNDDLRYARGEMALYDKAGDNNYSVRRIKFERGSVATPWSPALEDIEGHISTVESNFKQRADSLDAGVRSLTEGLRTKADISALNVTAENIRQSVKSLETYTQNKLDQKLSQAEFEVQAGSIRQEILNATKDKADKTLVVAEAGKLREEFSNLRFGGRNYYRGSDKLVTRPRFIQFDVYPYLTDDNIGQDWTFSFDLKINETGAVRQLHFYHYQQNGLALGVDTFFNPSKEWQRYSFTAKVVQGGTNPAYAKGAMALYDHAGDNNYSVRRIKFERGSVATPWSPALEDTEDLIKEAKATFERTAQGLRTDLSAIQEYVNKDGQRQEALQRYSREESAKQATAVRELIARDYVGKSTYQEDVRGIERRLEAITNPQNGSIATQIAAYKNSVDGRFADITSLIAGKANQTDFQRVRETSHLYERILGNTEDGIPDKIARMAMTSQLFQVEVGKAAQKGRNYYRDSEKVQTKTRFFAFPLHPYLTQENVGETWTLSFDLKINEGGEIRPLHFYHYQTNRFGIKASGDITPSKEWQRFTFTGPVIFPNDDPRYARGEMALYDYAGNNSYSVRRIKFERGTVATPWSPAPEDNDEAIRSVQSQLAGSWAVQNINSAGDIISGINLGANGHNRFDGKLTHITGETLIDKAVIKSAMIDKLKTANFEAGSVTTVILDAEAVTAEKLKVDQAFFNKLVANEAYLSQLFAKQAFINRVQSVAIDASQVRSGILSGDRIYGGTIRGASIYGGTLTGHTQIQLGTYGSFDTVNGGIQINVPRTVNAKDGLGVQFIGSYGRGENVPYGLFIYKDADFTVGGTAETSDDFLLTVEGYINAKGIGWLKTGKGSVNGKTTGTIGLWNSDNVSLSFGGSGNDIYYSYNGTAYSLWSVVNQHFSDRRLKENIVDCEHKALDYIQQFRFKEYDWRKQEDRPQQAHTNIGLIAQEVQEVDPTLVYENGDTMNLDNLRLTNIALKAIQELALENRKLIHRLENLENEYRTA
ncbi:TPA: phage tail spike protein [Streptococcus pneumoniae]|nr:tail fiber domain-containing protein [Streptococcus pneumoniae]